MTESAAVFPVAVGMSVFGVALILVAALSALHTQLMILNRREDGRVAVAWFESAMLTFLAVTHLRYTLTVWELIL